MCGGMRDVDCPMSGGLLSKFVGCACHGGMLDCVNRSSMVWVGVGRWSNFSCIAVWGVMFWHIRVSLCAPAPHVGRLR